MVRHEDDFLLIPRMYAYLVVAKVRVQEVEDFVADCTIYHSVDIKEGVRVFWTHLVKICVVYTHPPLVIILSDDDYIGQQIGVSGLPYEPD